MKFESTAIPDVFIATPALFRDERGYFFEAHRAKEIASHAGKAIEFVQGNISESVPHVLRGLHYQIKSPQGKYVRCTRGRIYDVAVDLRRTSPTFKKWVGVWLDNIEHKAIWVPPGFAHGFLTGPEGAQVVYECSTTFASEYERGILWNDPDLGISWPVPDLRHLTISIKDKHLPGIRTAELP